MAARRRRVRRRRAVRAVDGRAARRASSGPTASASTPTSGCSRRTTAPPSCTASPALASAAHAQHGTYLDMVSRDEWNPSDFAFHLSRRARGLPLWFSLATYGTDAYTAAVETTLDVARAFAAEVDRRDGFRLLLDPQLSVVLFTVDGWDDARYAAWSTSRAKAGVALVVPTWWQGADLLPHLPRQPADDVGDAERAPRRHGRLLTEVPSAIADQTDLGSGQTSSGLGASPSATRTCALVDELDEVRQHGAAGRLVQLLVDVARTAGRRWPGSRRGRRARRRAPAARAGGGARRGRRRSAAASSIDGPCVGQYVRSARPATLRSESTYAAMSPSGGDTTVVLQPITWSPVNSTPSSSNAKQMWFDVCPGVCTPRRVQPGPRRRDLAVGDATSGSKARSMRLLDLDALGDLLVELVVLDLVVGSAGGCGPNANVGAPVSVAQPRGERRVVAVAVGDEDRRDPLAGERGAQRVAVAVEIGPGSTTATSPVADDVRAGAAVGELRRVLGDRRAGSAAPPGRRARRRRRRAGGTPARCSRRSPPSERTAPTGAPWPRIGSTTASAATSTPSERRAAIVTGVAGPASAVGDLHGHGAAVGQRRDRTPSAPSLAISPGTSRISRVTSRRGPPTISGMAASSPGAPACPSTATAGRRGPARRATSPAPARRTRRPRCRSRRRHRRRGAATMSALQRVVGSRYPPSASR